MIQIPEFNALTKEWDRAEQCIKIAEQITGQVAIPCVMELRYAGRRICEAARLVETNIAKSHELLTDAKFDCLRAQHDAIDISVNYIAGFIDKALTHAEPLALAGKYNDIANYLTVVEGYQKKIAESRLNREKRSELYDEVELDLNKIREDFSSFKKQLVEIIEESDLFYENKSSTRSSILIEALRAERSRGTYTVLLTATAIVGVLLSVISNLLAW